MDLSRRTFLGALAAGTFVPTLPTANGGVITTSTGPAIVHTGETILPTAMAEKIIRAHWQASPRMNLKGGGKNLSL